MYILTIFDEALVGIELFVVTQLYKLAANVFKIFMILAQSDFLEQINYGRLITNFYVILGIIMLFIMAFALLRGMINPDDQKQGTTAVKNIIVNFVISCVILGFLPTVFPFMFDVQDSILRYNVIGGFFGFGTPMKKLTNAETVNEVEASSYRMVNGIFTAFFNVSTSFCDGVSSSGSSIEDLTNCQKQLTTDPLVINDHKDNYFEDNDNLYGYINHVDSTADFAVYANFISDAADNNIDFGFFALLVSGVLLIYVGISYCFDMALRLIKLIFYQAIAPIPIFLRIIPNSKFSGTFNQWLKVTLTCYLEVFVRIFIFSFCMWLCRAMQSTNFMTDEIYKYGKLAGLFAKAFILMAIVTFMKRSPKLLSEITGIDSGNMKLGIREKIAEGGGFVAGAAVGGLATAGIRNTVGAVRRTREAYKEAAKNGAGGWKKAGIIAKGVGSGALSFIGGAGSGAVRSGKNAVGKKTFRDTSSAISAGVEATVAKGEKRHSYIAQHGGIVKSMGAHAEGAVRGVGAYFGIGANGVATGKYIKAAQMSDSQNSAGESTYKNKKEYQDQSSIVKRMAAENAKTIQRLDELKEKVLNNTITSAERTEMARLQNDANYKAYLKEKDTLTELRKDLSKGKENVLAGAATNIAVDQSRNYASDAELSLAYKQALAKAFNGVLDASGNITGLSGNNLKIVEAMLSGRAVDNSWITRENVINIQDALDEINIGRQNIKAKYEREYTVASGGSQSSGKGNS